MKILIIGGARNLGHSLTHSLLAAGHQVNVLNRGLTPDKLPVNVERLHGDRSDQAQLNDLLSGRSFDAVIDTTLYNGADAKSIIETLQGNTGHYIFLSTGQVYLIREGLERPFKEEDYEGPVMAAPATGSPDSADWKYGFHKREAEDLLFEAWNARHFPFTTLRLPMVNSERDHFHRILGYLLRMRDGSPLLVPAAPHLPLRHVYGEDVVQAVLRLIHSGKGKGCAYNISQNETVSIEEFLTILAEVAGCSVRQERSDRAILHKAGLLPQCSPFSDPWMSALDNQLSCSELGMEYTPLKTYPQQIVAYYDGHRTNVPEGYLQRSKELELLRQGFVSDL